MMRTPKHNRVFEMSEMVQDSYVCHNKKSQRATKDKNIEKNPADIKIVLRIHLSYENMVNFKTFYCFNTHYDNSWIFLSTS